MSLQEAEAVAEEIAIGESLGEKREWCGGREEKNWRR